MSNNILILLKIGQSGFFSNKPYFDTINNNDYIENIKNISEIGTAIYKNNSYVNTGLNVTIIDNINFNSSSYFRDILENGDIEDKEAILKIYENGLLLETYNFVLTGISKNLNDLNLTFTKEATLSSVTFPSNYIDLSNYPEAPESSTGSIIPIIIGDLDTENGAVECKRIGNNKFIVADHVVESVEKVFDSEGVELENFTYFTEKNKTVLVVSTEKDTVFCNVKGYYDTELLQNPIKVLKLIMSKYLSISYNETSLNNAEVIFENRGYKMDAILNNNQSFRQFLSLFCNSFACSWFIDSLGALNIIVPDIDTTLTPVTIDQKDLINVSNNQDNYDLRTNLINYSYYKVRGEYKKANTYTLQSSAKKENSVFFLEYVKNKETALDVIERQLSQGAFSYKTLTITGSFIELENYKINDLIKINSVLTIDNNITYRVTGIFKNYLAKTITLTLESFYLRKFYTVEIKSSGAGAVDIGTGFFAVEKGSNLTVNFLDPDFAKAILYNDTDPRKIILLDKYDPDKLILPNENSTVTIDSLFIDGVYTVPTSNNYTFTNIQKNYTLEVNFGNISGQGEAILTIESSDGIDTNPIERVYPRVNIGSKLAIIAELQAGYNFLNWTKNSNIIGTQESIYVTIDSNPCVIKANATTDDPPSGNVQLSVFPQYRADGWDGECLPAGIFNVVQGANQVINVTLDNNVEVEYVARTDQNGTTYISGATGNITEFTVENIQIDTICRVFFKNLNT